MSRILRVLAPLALLAAVGLPAAPAWAHAALVSSDPADGQRLPALPGTATLSFNEEISPPSYVVVTAPDGSRADRGEPRVDGTKVTVDLAKGREGTYALAFRVISADGHPVTGRLTFVVGDGPLDTTGPTLAATPGDSPASGRAAASEGGDLGLGTVQIAVGAGLFAVAGLLWVLARRRPR